MQKPSVLVLGHHSFAAMGLVSHLRSQGHRVLTFTRGETRRAGDDFWGPALQMGELEELGAETVDVVVNFIVLKNDSVEHNVQFMKQLLKLCSRMRAPRLIHISSASVYPASASTISESTETESDPAQKGVYGAWKVAAERTLLENAPPELMLSLVRPGFILGAGLLDPIVGNAIRLPGGNVLILGNGATELPVTHRALLFDAIEKIMSAPLRAGVERLLLVHPNSPTRRDYVAECARTLGVGKELWELPVPVWTMVGLGAEVVARMLGKGSIKPWLKVRALCSEQHYSPDGSAAKLGVDLVFGWQKELGLSLEQQQLNFVIPHSTGERVSFTPQQVSIVGYGRIAQKSHAPALKALGLDGEVEALDKASFVAPDGRAVQAIGKDAASTADLAVICTPGPLHLTTLQELNLKSGARVLVEKPLAIRSEDLPAWEAIGRKRPVFVGHNYRFKRNVVSMVEYLKRRAPGALHRVVVEFQSPPVTYDSALWLRNERQARTLLLDYALHFMDLATMFSQGPWVGEKEQIQLNASGQTHAISGTARAPEYEVSYFLRQGFGRKTASLEFVFENYTVCLKFFPDTFSVRHGADSPVQVGSEMVGAASALGKKIASRLRGVDDDASHQQLYREICSDNPEDASVHLSRLMGFYTFILKLADRVYA